MPQSGIIIVVMKEANTSRPVHNTQQVATFRTVVLNTERVVPDVSKECSAFLFQNSHRHYDISKCRKLLIKRHGVIPRRV